MLLASCVGQHRREGSKAEPRYRLRELMLQAMLQQQKGSNGGGPVCLMGGGVRGEEEGKRLQLEVGCEVEAWRAHLRGLETALRQDDHHPVGSSSSSTRARAPHNAAAADTKVSRAGRPGPAWLSCLLHWFMCPSHTCTCMAASGEGQEAGGGRLVREAGGAGGRR